MVAELMNEKLIIERPTTTNKYGEKARIVISILCRIEFADKLIKTSAGETASSIGAMSTVQIYSATEIKRGDKTTINEISYKVERVDPIKDITNTVRHYEAYLI